MTRIPCHHRGMRRGLALVFLFALGAWEPFRAADPDVEAGNKAYAEGRYDDALAAYERAEGNKSLDKAGLAFDKGTALLKKAEGASGADKKALIDRGLEELAKAGLSKDARLRGAAQHNRGNAMMQQDKLEDAIEAYKQALREDPQLEDARLNLELALRRREKKEQRQKQQQQG